MGRVKKTKNVQSERLSHSSVHPSAHMTATSKYAICSSQHGEKREEAEIKKKTLYHSCMNNTAPVCSASDNAQLLVIYPLSPVFKDTLRHM